MFVRFVGGSAHNRFFDVPLLPDRTFPRDVDLPVTVCGGEPVAFLSYQCCQLICERGRTVFFEYHCRGDARPFSGSYWFPGRGF